MCEKCFVQIKTNPIDVNNLFEGRFYFLSGLYSGVKDYFFFQNEKRSGSKNRKEPENQNEKVFRRENNLFLIQQTIKRDS